MTILQSVLYIFKLFTLSNMKDFFNLIFLTLLLSCVCSCNLPGGVSIGPVGDDGMETITLDFSKVGLKFDFSKSLNVPFVISDYSELVAAHNTVDNNWDKCSGTINNLGAILWNVGSYDESHKPSITVTVEDVFMGKKVHNCKKEDVAWNTVVGIPKISNFYQGTVEIKSIKTQDNGVQVVWTKSALKDNWPINEFVKDGTVSCDVTAFTKVGTNNDRGNVAVRDNIIISNTSDYPLNRDDRFVIDDRQLISPDLRKSVLIKGEVSNKAKWSEPVIYKAE